jgi:hypothetical protein
MNIYPINNEKSKLIEVKRERIKLRLNSIRLLLYESFLKREKLSYYYYSSSLLDKRKTNKYHGNIILMI